jgi:hypothetical protein
MIVFLRSINHNAPCEKSKCCLRMRPPFGQGERGQVTCPIAIPARYAGSLLHTAVGGR